MDIPRYALIAASLLLGLMLLGEWTRFSEAQKGGGAARNPDGDTILIGQWPLR